MPPRDGQSESGQRGSHLGERVFEILCSKATAKPFSLCSSFDPLVGAPALFSAVMRFSSMPAQAAAESINSANSAARAHNFPFRLRSLLPPTSPPTPPLCRLLLPAPPSRRPSPACPRPRPPPRPCACESPFYSFSLKRVFERRRGPARAGGGKEGACNQPRRRRWENKSSLSPRSLPLPPSLPSAHQFPSTAGSRLTTSKCRWRKGSKSVCYRSARGRKKKRLESSRAFEAAKDGATTGSRSRPRSEPHPPLPSPLSLATDANNAPIVSRVEEAASVPGIGRAERTKFAIQFERERRKPQTTAFALLLPSPSAASPLRCLVAPSTVLLFLLLFPRDQRG